MGKPEISDEVRIMVEAYRDVFGSSLGQIVLNDLVRHTEDADDVAVRAGRQDMVMRILRQIRRAKEVSRGD